MGIISGITRKIFGSKSDRDIKEVFSRVEKIKEEYDKLTSISNDELRRISAELRKYIIDKIHEDNEKLAELKEQGESDEVDVQEKEKIYQNIDKLEKAITEKLDATLDEVLPQAFAIIKDTARRFKENENHTLVG